MRLELRNARERIVEIPREADRAIVDEDVRRRLLARDGIHGVIESVLAKPPAHTHGMPRREDDDVEATRAERLEEGTRAGPRRVPVIGITPSSIVVEDAVQIDADDGANRIVEVEAPHAIERARPAML
jgi:hypothetical protein